MQLQGVKSFLLNSSTLLNAHQEPHKFSLPQFQLPSGWLEFTDPLVFLTAFFVCSEVYTALPSCLHLQHLALTPRVEASPQTLIPVN